MALSMPVALSTISRCGNNLQINGDMKPAYCFTFKRNNMIDMMNNPSCFSQFSSLFIKLFNDVKVRLSEPFRGSLEFKRSPFSSCGINFVGVLLHPFKASSIVFLFVFRLSYSFLFVCFCKRLRIAPIFYVIPVLFNRFCEVILEKYITIFSYITMFKWLFGFGIDSLHVLILRYSNLIVGKLDCDIGTIRASNPFRFPIFTNAKNGANSPLKGELLWL